MTHKAAVTEQIKAIPRRRLAAKISKSVFGLLFIAGAAYGAATLGWAWYVVLPVAMFGAHIFSEELTRTAVQFVVNEGHSEHAPAFLQRIGLSVHALIGPDGMIYTGPPPERIWFHAGKSR